jgi:hypothetical protein
MTITSGLAPSRPVIGVLHSGCNKRIAMPASAEREPARGVKKPNIKEMPITKASRIGAHIPMLEVCGSISQEKA